LRPPLPKLSSGRWTRHVLFACLGAAVLSFCVLVLAPAQATVSAHTIEHATRAALTADAHASTLQFAASIARGSDARPLNRLDRHAIWRLVAAAAPAMLLWGLALSVTGRPAAARQHLQLGRAPPA
jgi:hypothetical protein